MPSVMYGDDLVPVWRRPWRSAGDLGGFRMISELEVGQHWTEARLAPNMHEHLPVIDGAPVPVGVAIAADLIRDGADVAYCTELLMPRPLVTLDSLGRHHRLAHLEAARVSRPRADAERPRSPMP
jgi:hypothetical protein